MRNHLTRQQLESLTLCWEQWEAEAATRTQKTLRARLHLIFLLMRYGGLRRGGQERGQQAQGGRGVPHYRLLSRRHRQAPGLGAVP